MAQGTIGSRLRLGCGEYFFVEQRLAYLEPALDLPARESPATSKFQESLVGGLIDRAFSTGAKQIGQGNLERLRDPDQGFIAGAARSSLEQRCEAHGDSAPRRERLLCQPVPSSQGADSPCQVLEGVSRFAGAVRR